MRPDNSQPQARKALDRIASLLNSREGLNLAPDKLWLLERRVTERQRQIESRSLDDYAALLESEGGPAELRRLVEVIRVGETRFFRLGDHERALRRVALPELWTRRAPTALQIWSAGCATGEEPYTVAMIVDDWLRQAQAPPRSFQVLATDFSADALSVAREACYDLAAVEAVPPRLLERYFDSSPAGRRVRSEIREHVKMVQHNLVGDAIPGRFDLVLCRNVLIYFDRPTREMVLQRLTASLALHGFLFLGTSEVLQPVPAGLAQLRTPDGPIYQRTDAGIETGAAVGAAGRPDNDSVDGRQAPTKPERGAPVVVRLHGSYDDAESQRLSDELRGALVPGGGRYAIDLDGAAYLATDCARVLRRLASSLPEGGLVMIASRPGVKRWVERNRELLGEIPCHGSLAEVHR